MKWYHYVACFFAGVFLINSFPHLVHGLDCEAFPTPFADPPGKGLSSPVVNVLWFQFNCAVSLSLVHIGKLRFENKMAMLVFFAGIALASLAFSFMAPDVLELYWKSKE
jgi:hypothetical protein